jgi:hypothetical protein
MLSGVYIGAATTLPKHGFCAAAPPVPIKFTGTTAEFREFSRRNQAEIDKCTSLDDLREMFYRNDAKIVNIVGNKIGSSSFEYDDVSEKDMEFICDQMWMQDGTTLNLLGATMSKGCGWKLALAFKNPLFPVENLLFHASQVRESEMLHLLKALETNTKLKYLFARSYNCQTRSWSRKEIDALIRVLQNNRSLAKIEVPNNYIEDYEAIASLKEALKVTQKELIGFESSYGPLTFNKQ